MKRIQLADRGLRIEKSKHRPDEGLAHFQEAL